MHPGQPCRGAQSIPGRAIRPSKALSLPFFGSYGIPDTEFYRLKGPSIYPRLRPDMELLSTVADLGTHGDY